jgi:uncharacterized membrane protein (DUF106 family)
MTRIERRVDELAEEGESMMDALAQVLAVADEQGVVTWGDVSDDLSSGQWGRLIESGLLVDAEGEGFVLDDPSAVREALEESDPEPDEDEDDGWTTYDKLAALGSLGMFAGYSMAEVRAVIGGALDVVLGPLNSMVPFYIVILIIAVLTGLYSTILQDNLMNMDVMSDFQEKKKELDERRERAKERDDQEALDQIQQEQMEMMGDQAGMFKAQFRPMVWIMLLTIPMFLWMFYIIRDVGLVVEGPAMIMPIIGTVPSWTQPIIGPLQAWILWYFLCSMGFTQIIRKSLNVQTSPT